MKISVVIPSLDGTRGGNVARLKEQLARQTLPPHEVVVVVGVSPNGRARNEGAAQTTGDVLVFIDDDVTLGDDRVLESLVKPFLERDDIGMTGPSQLIPEDSAWWQRAAARQIPRSLFPVQRELVDSDMVSHMCLAMPADLYRQVGAEHPDIVAGTDPDLRHRVRQAGKRVCVVPGCWAYHPMPETMGGLLSQAFAKGRNSAMVRRTHPELVLELDAGHRAQFPARRPLSYRIVRMAGRMLVDLLAGRLFGLAYRLVYGLGNLAETVSADGARSSSAFHAIFPLSLTAGVVLFLIMPWGPGVSPDSTVYLNVAENLVAGKGLLVDLHEPAPMIHFPPLYPVFLAGIMMALGCGAVMAARVGNALVFAASLILVVRICRGGGYSSWQGWAAFLLFASSEMVLLPHVTVGSEPLFLAMALLCLASVGDICRDGGMGGLGVGVLAAGAACLTRYAGFSLVIAGALALLVLRPVGVRWLRRGRDALLFATVAMLPLLFWMMRNHLVAGAATNRQLGFHPMGLAKCNHLVRSALFVVLPDAMLEHLKVMRLGSSSMPLVLVGIGVVGLAIAAFRWRCPIFCMCRRCARALPMHARVLGLFIPVYGGFLLFSITCLDANTPLDYRITGPAAALLLVLLPRLTSPEAGRYVAAMSLLALIFLVPTYSMRAMDFALRNVHDGQGYTGRVWQECPLIDAVRRLPETTPIYSNGQAAIRFILGRHTRPLPARKVALTGKEDPDFDRQMMEMGRAVVDEGARLVFFARVPEGHAVSFAEVDAVLPVQKEVAVPAGIMCGRRR